MNIGMPQSVQYVNSKAFMRNLMRLTENAMSTGTSKSELKP